MSQKIWKIVSFVTFCESTWVRYFSTYCLLLVVSWQVVRKPRQVHMSVSDVFEGTPSFVSNILKWNSEETFNSYSGQHLHKHTFNVKVLHFEKSQCEGSIFSWQYCRGFYFWIINLTTVLDLFLQTMLIHKFRKLVVARFN